jgi:hypothetical protein
MAPEYSPGEPLITHLVYEDGVERLYEPMFALDDEEGKRKVRHSPSFRAGCDREAVGNEIRLLLQCSNRIEESHSSFRSVSNEEEEEEAGPVYPEHSRRFHQEQSPRRPRLIVDWQGCLFP